MNNGGIMGVVFSVWIVGFSIGLWNGNLESSLIE